MNFSMNVNLGSGHKKGLGSWVTQWLVNAVGLALVARFVDGVRLEAADPARAALTVLGAAAVLGLLNLLVKPFLILITLPVNILSLGLFTLVINGLVLWMVSAFMPGFAIAGFGTAVWAALCLSLCTMVFNALLGGADIRVRGGRKS